LWKEVPLTAAKKLQLVSVEDYLEGELTSPIKHEFSGGVVYAMAGAKNLHNRIAGNIFARLHVRLLGKPCQPYNSDTKVHVRYPTYDKFYYPDVSVVCDSNPEDDSYQDRPVVIFEVLSRKTRRIDEGEKKEAYLTIPTLQLYALVEQETAKIVAFRRIAGKFVGEVYEGLDAVLPLPAIGIELPLAEIYADLQLVPEPEAE
jgi:Uma2 family endonuclease